jgi:hypothetical protein
MDTKEGSLMVGSQLSASALERRAQVALQNGPVGELRDLRIEQQGFRLTIFGRLSSFYHKQLAQELVGAVIDDDLVELVNLVEVDCPL